MNATRMLGKTLLMLAVALWVGLAPLAGQVESATVMVDGLACPFCAFGIEKLLKQVDGVGRVEVDLKSGEVALTATVGESIAVTEIPAAVEKAGFTAGAIRLTAVGTLQLDDQERSLFRVGEGGQELLLVGIGALRERLEELASSGARTRIRGELHLQGDDLPGLEPGFAELVGR